MSFINQFLKISISWPQQPPTQKMLKFKIIFHCSMQKKLFSKHEYKAEFKNLDDSEVLRSDFPGIRTSMISTVRKVVIDGLACQLLSS